MNFRLLAMGGLLCAIWIGAEGIGFGDNAVLAYQPKGYFVPARKPAPALDTKDGSPATTPQPSISEQDSEQDAADADEERRVQAYSHYAMGVARELNQDPDGALVEFYGAAMADPQNEPLVVEVSRRLIQRKKTTEALDLLKLSASNPNASASVYTWLGVVYAQIGDKENAIKANQTALKRQKNLLLACQNLSELYLQSGKGKEAVAVIDGVIKAGRSDVVTLIGVGEILVGNATALEKYGDVQQRLTNILNQIGQLKVENPVLQEKLADIYRVAGVHGKAAEIYKTLLVRFPIPGLREKLVECYLRLDNREKAMEQLELLVREAPTRPQGYMLLGGLAFEGKEYQKAIDYYQKALLVDANLNEAMFRVALAQLALQKSADAVETLKKMAVRSPNNFTVEFYTALAYVRMKDYKTAMEHLTSAEIIGKATDTNRLNQSFYFQMGATWERLGDLSQAERYFNIALSMEPDFSEAMNYMGYMWAEKGIKLKEARKLIEKALKNEPNNPAFLDSMAWVLFRLNQSKDALEYMEKSIKLSPEKDATLYEHLGDILASLKKTGPAREAYMKALEIEKNEDIQKKLEKLPASP